jgi:hypothetical protein
MKKTNHLPEKLEEIKEQALALMKGAGFEITQPVNVLLDPALPFMGYTTEQNGKPIIVVSEAAMRGGMAINLLIHELSHIYRSQTKHPSHDYHLLTNITSWVTQGKVMYEFQEKVLENILNHLQDLYADDVSFKIFTTNTPQQDLNEFFLTWIHEHSAATEPTQRSWENADNLLSTAFAAANLERHGIPDKDGKVAKAVEQFLENAGKEKRDKFHFFKEFMVLLPENVTEKQFENLLIAYLSEFLKLTKIV